MTPRQGRSQPAPTLACSLKWYYPVTTPIHTATDLDYKAQIPIQIQIQTYALDYHDYEYPD